MTHLQGDRAVLQVNPVGSKRFADPNGEFDNLTPLELSFWVQLNQYVAPLLHSVDVGRKVKPDGMIVPEIEREEELPKEKFRIWKNLSRVRHSVEGGFRCDQVEKTRLAVSQGPEATSARLKLVSRSSESSRVRRVPGKRDRSEYSFRRRHKHKMP